MKTSFLIFSLLFEAISCTAYDPIYNQIEHFDGQAIDQLATGKILAGNRIKVAAKTNGAYTLAYDKNGELLDEYADICTLTVKQITYYEDFIDINIAPAEADLIGIYDSTGSRLGSITLSYLKSGKSEQPLYSFGVLSDVHIGRDYIHPEADLRNALDFFHLNNAEFTCICGDITQNGLESELDIYQSIISDSESPVHTTTGNHDCNKGIDTELWERYTGNPITFEKEIEHNGKIDHFLFLGMSYWNFRNGYLNEHISWLEEKLEEYKHNRCFIFTHLFFPDRAGNMNKIYPQANWLKGSQLERLEKLCNTYTNTIWFSGHSHWSWELQKYQDIANVHRIYNGNTPCSGWAIHVPSCGAPITSNGHTRQEFPAGSEGGLVLVYDDYIELMGVNLIESKFLPIGTYRLYF